MVVEIPCGHGISGVVSDKDGVPALLFSSWNLNSQGYIQGKQNIPLHQWIAKRMGLKGRIDHKDQNPLNCQRSNLREASRSQNCANVAQRAKSKYRGVSKHGQRYIARICKDNVRYLSALYVNEKDAARIYDEMAIKLHGEFAVLNFPKEER